MMTLIKTISCVFLFFIHIGIYAQLTGETKPIVVEDITKAISKGEQPGFKVDIYQADKKDVESAWSKDFRKETKSKAENSNNEFSIKGTVLKEISVLPLNVYAIFNQYSGYLELNVFFESDSIFLTKEKSESEYLAAKKFVRDFALDEYRAAVKEELKAEEDKLKGLESELKGLVKVNDKVYGKISQVKRAIEKTKDKIATSELDQDRARGIVQNNKDELSRFKTNNADEAVIKSAEKKLKASEKELAKLQKEEDGLHKSITKSEAGIREHERKIASNELAIQTKQRDLEKQKEVVRAVEKKLDSIN